MPVHASTNALDAYQMVLLPANFCSWVNELAEMSFPFLFELSAQSVVQVFSVWLHCVWGMLCTSFAAVSVSKRWLLRARACFVPSSLLEKAFN